METVVGASAREGEIIIKSGVYQPAPTPSAPRNNISPAHEDEVIQRRGDEADEDGRSFRWTASGCSDRGVDGLSASLRGMWPTRPLALRGVRRGVPALSAALVPWLWFAV